LELELLEAVRDIADRRGLYPSAVIMESVGELVSRSLEVEGGMAAEADCLGSEARPSGRARKQRCRRTSSVS
jgi:hypothetical protein